MVRLQRAVRSCGMQRSEANGLHKLSRKLLCMRVLVP